jgi:hypothetical protein
MNTSDILDALNYIGGFSNVYEDYSELYKNFEKNSENLPVVGVYILDENDFVEGDGKGMQVFRGIVGIDCWCLQKDKADVISRIKKSMYSLDRYIVQNNFHEISEPEGVKHLVWEFRII